MEEYRYAVVYRSNPTVRLSKTFTRKGDAKAFRENDSMVIRKHIR
ncbi:hypothetical protein P4H82_27870 [Bacillus cereus]|nr:hypothetical protein [Bacillus cereus]MEB9190662.1 hypothetical protein [Bacillus cereus]